MNALCDKTIIEALYEASAAGVKIDLIIRGICCLKVGLPGISENICVRSIVGNYLEHARIFYFENDGRQEFYCASADWMPRNLDRRVEIMFPIEKRALQDKIIRILEYQLKDTVKAHLLLPDDTYTKVDMRGKEKFNSQLAFCELAQNCARKQEEAADRRVFIPEMSQTAERTLLL